MADYERVEGGDGDKDGAAPAHGARIVSQPKVLDGVPELCERGAWDHGGDAGRARRPRDGDVRGASGAAGFVSFPFQGFAAGLGAKFLRVVSYELFGFE